MKSCCTEDSASDSSADDMQCHTELHVVKLSVNALNIASIQMFSVVAPMIAIIPVADVLAQTKSSSALCALTLDTPPPQYTNRTILFRSLLI